MDDHGGVQPGAPDADRGRPDPVRGMHRFYVGLDELVLELLADILEGLELRLAFEAWADAREA